MKTKISTEYRVALRHVPPIHQGGLPPGEKQAEASRAASRELLASTMHNYIALLFYPLSAQKHPLGGSAYTVENASAVLYMYTYPPPLLNGLPETSYSLNFATVLKAFHPLPRARPGKAKSC